MNRVALLSLAVIAALALAPSSRAEVKLMAASAEEHAWLLVKQSWRGEDSWDLYHESAAAPPGTLTRVMPLPEKPVAVAASGRRVVMVHAARPGPDDASVRPVRSVTAVARGVGGVYQYRPGGRAQAEAPLPGSGVLVDLAGGPDGPVALLRATSERGDGRLLALDESEWVERPLPEGLDPLGAWTLDEGPDGVVLRSGADAWVWTSSEGGEGEAGGAWRRESLPVPDGATLLASGQQLLAARWSEPGVELVLLRSGQAFDLALIPDVPESSAVVSVAESVTAYWFDPEDPNRLRAATVSSISGEQLFAGPVGSPSPLGQEDLQLISLVAASVLLIIILFLLRPEGELHAEPTLPLWAALAEPGPRLAAALIDVAPAAAISSLVWGVPVWASVSPGLSIEASGGLMPIFTTAGLFFLHSAASEWATGRTLGKALTGLRTVDSRGKGRGEEGLGLRARQAVIRNLFKAVFPPLTILLLLDPARRHPADQVSSTVVVGRARRPGEDEGDEGSTRG